MRNPYLSETPTILSFSGGRSSAYMLWKTLSAYGGKLPEHIVVCFTNTGKELEQTLRFVDRCSREWCVPLIWLERYALPRQDGGDGPKFSYQVKQVDFSTAARHGEPFEALITERQFLPNPVARFCTVELKIRAVKQYAEELLGWETPFTSFLGIRADEATRARKLHGKVDSGQESWCPLYLDGVTKGEVATFWRSQPFDLELPNNNGVTDWGNCDLCFLKGQKKKLSIVRERPELADWWAAQEAAVSETAGTGAFFRNDHASYQTMQLIATSAQPSFDFLTDDETIPCFCGD